MVVVVVQPYAKYRHRTGTAQELAVTLSIDPARLALPVIEGIRTGSLDILVACFDERGGGIGQNYERANVRLTVEEYQKALKSGLPYSVRFETKAGVRKVRVVVYDYRADLIGSADASVY